VVLFTRTESLIAVDLQTNINSKGKIKNIWRKKQSSMITCPNVCTGERRNREGKKMKYKILNKKRLTKEKLTRRENPHPQI